MDPQSDVPTLRERTRRAVHAEIAGTALRLFVEQGFEATTVDQIAAAAGISRRSFFHYFGSKEDVVMGDLEALGLRVRETLEARPATETAWEALRETFIDLHQRGTDAATPLQIANMYADAPSLRARHLEKHLRWQELLAPDIERRLGIEPGAAADPRARAVIAAALACLDVAVEAWRQSGGTSDPVDLFDQAVAALRA
ncbi:TetR/AcrR family transcriptional regulator [Promicromonospora sp. CA-289599]|uniref:TetR/AcrR family transcriptional regulator n=1 Tax=Promicromonospora sp. CA-289599 TaxID=3240014 RepID=UPI003D89B12D